MLRSRLAALSATLAVVAVACGGASDVATDAGATAPEQPAATGTAPAGDATIPDATPDAPTSEAPTAPAESGPAANATVLSFSAQAVGGGTVEGVDYAGGDVVLWIWAPW